MPAAGGVCRRPNWLAGIKPITSRQSGAARSWTAKHGRYHLSRTGSIRRPAADHRGRSRSESRCERASDGSCYASDTHPSFPRTPKGLEALSVTQHLSQSNRTNVLLRPPIWMLGSRQRSRLTLSLHTQLAIFNLRREGNALPPATGSHWNWGARSNKPCGQDRASEVDDAGQRPVARVDPRAGVAACRC